MQSRRTRHPVVVRHITAVCSSAWTELSVLGRSKRRGQSALTRLYEPALPDATFVAYRRDVELLARRASAGRAVRKLMCRSVRQVGNFPGTAGAPG